MEYPFLPIFTLLNLVLVATHAAMTPELYWKSVLPTTPMPKAITDILHPGGKNYKFAAGQKNNKLDADAQKGYQKHYKLDADRVQKNYKIHYNHAAGQKNDKLDADRVQKNYKIHYNHAAGQKNDKLDATETQLPNDPTAALFFLEKDLHPGAKLDLHFVRSSNAATFLPREVADTKPFSSEKLDDIYNEFSVKPGSEEAQIMKNTIEECEETGIKGEEKYCATSLESMVDFSISKLGKNVDAVSTTVDKETESQKYTITPGVKKLSEGKVVACHKQDYPYAVFYCHKFETTRAYSVPLEGANGVRAKAVAVCHIDTSEWNPKHLAFQVLKVKPGTLPVCHFLSEENVAWVPK